MPNSRCLVDIIINDVAVRRGSRGARRYFENVMEHLRHPDDNICHSRRYGNPYVERAAEVFSRGRRNAIFWSPAHRGPWFAHNHVVTVLDCINLEYVYRGKPQEPLVRANLRLLLGNAKHIVCISNATRDRVLANFDLELERISAIPGPILFPQGPPLSAVEDRSYSRRPRIVLITNKLGHKNTDFAATAISRSRMKAVGGEVVVIGSLTETAYQTLAQANVKCINKLAVSDEEVRQTLLSSSFLLSPSLSEGLNLPVAEALSLGVNVLCSDIPVHREFYDGEVSFFDVESLDSCIDQINLGLDRQVLWHPKVPKHRLSYPDVAAGYRAIFSNIQLEMSHQ